jgi:hypothetical protein
MKKPKPVAVAKVNPNVLAKTLKKTLGVDRAFKVADSLSKNLLEITDSGSTIFTPKEIFKNARIWTQVRNILQK